MTAIFSDAELRRWLVDYLITNIGCDADDIDLDKSFSDLGIGSRDAVVLSGELAELVGRGVSPLELWHHPTINDLVKYLTSPEPEIHAGTTDSADRSRVDEPIAVIGVGCRFPGDINGPESFWQFLCEGRSAVGEVPPDRWAPFDDGSPEAAAALSGTTRWGSFLADIDAFDAEFFEISPREAAKIDPQQRLLLEVAHEALEDAGIQADSLRRTQTGVFAGACTGEYGYLASTDLSQVDAWSGTGGALSVIANRVSYFFDLRGPSVTVDTACSSSLVAVHLACQSLRTGESNLAIAAGVNLLLSPVVTRSLDQAGAMSPTGQCQPFDASADGFVRGEGCGVVLKGLTDALRDGDRVLAVVRGSAVNQDGRSNGLMAPNPAAQMAVLRAACSKAGVPPHEVGYVEAHGTGTLLGDPIEARALGTVLGRARPPSAPLLIGSVKSSLGHLDAASGIAGFIKAVLTVQRGHIPANLNFRTPNPHIPFEDLRLKVVGEPTDWPATGQPRRAGVSSFGFGGTNAHVVLEQAPAAKPIASQPDPAVTTLVVSGKTPERIASTAGVLADWMDVYGADVALADVAHTLNHHRSRHAKFATVCAADRARAVEGLRALAAGYSAPGVVGPHHGPCGSGTVFVFSGQGSEWAGMGRRLLVDEPAFAAAVAELEPVFVEQVGFSLQRVLGNGEPVSGDARLQPVLVGLQLALTELWRSYGVIPDAVIGHSMGDVPAAVVAGALTAAEGLRLIAIRSRLMSRLAGKGAVALLKLDAEATAALIADYPGVSVSGFSSPRRTVIAGPPEQVDAVIAAVTQLGRFARRVNMEVASHSACMDPILPELHSALAYLTPNAPLIRFISTVADTTTTPVLDADYWVANVRQPVRLTRAITTAATDHTTFIEISPHPLLTHAITESLGDIHHHSIGTLQRGTHDTLTFHTNLNSTQTTQPPETPHPPEPHQVIPTTPWHHTRHWMSPPALRRNGIAAPGTRAGVPDDWFYELSWPVRELRVVDTATTGSWLVLGDNDIGVQLRQALAVDSQVAVTAPSVLEQDGAALLNVLAGVRNVLYAPSVPRAHLDINSAYRLFNALKRLATTLAGMASTSKRPPKLIVVTRNAQPVDDGDRANPGHAILWGLCRTLALDYPEIWGSVIDVDDSVPAELLVQYVLAEVHSTDGEDQVVYQAGLRRVPRLERRTPPTVAAAPLHGDTSHLVIGATGAIGPSLIRQLSDMGASTIVVVSRHAGSQLAALISSLASTGTKLIEVDADATDEAALTALFQRFGADLPPLDGIYLAALAARPVLLDAVTDDDANTMFRPVLDAVTVLHKLSLKAQVRRFALFSSIAGVIGPIGSPSHAHYVATGAFLDTFAYARRALGLAATVVDWGLWKSVGDEQPATTDVGLQPMPNEVALRALPAVLSADSGVRCAVVAADWGRLAAAYRMRGSLRVVEDLLPHDSRDDSDVTAWRPAPHLLTIKERVEAAVSAPRSGALLGEHIKIATTPPVHLWQAWLKPETKPYPGFHRIGGTDVVPISVLSQTLSTAAAECGASALSDVRFEYPIVVNQPRVIQVVADGESVTVSSGSAADTLARGWIRHASARMSQRLQDHPDDKFISVDQEMPDYDISSVTELKRAWGIEGQAFPWSINSCRSSQDVLRADVDLPEVSTVALLDAALHVARLVDISDPRLMLPAEAESVCFHDTLADSHGGVEVHRRGGNRDELIVDIAVTAPDGSRCVDVRSLRYTAVESGPRPIGSHDAAPVAWSQLPAGQILSELETRLRAILAKELGMAASALDVDRPFPELGLDSMMAMAFLKESQRLVGFDLSATMFWNHPTISSLAKHLAQLLAVQDIPDIGVESEGVQVTTGSEDSVLDALFASVESATAGSESGIR